MGWRRIDDMRPRSGRQSIEASLAVEKIDDSVRPFLIAIFAEAADWADKAIRAFPPSFLVGDGQLILCYVGAGRLEEARKLMANCLRRRPDWRRSTYMPAQWVRSPKLRAEFLEAFLAAGLPE